MKKVTVHFFPDMREILINLKMEMSLDECFDKIRIFCEKYKDTLRRAEVLVYDEDNKLMFMLRGATESYRLEDKYKELEPMLLEIYEEYFQNAVKSSMKSISVEELKNTEVVIRGYAIPQDIDYAPDYFKRCKLGEAYEILKEYVTDFPEEFYNLQFHVWTKEEVYLFTIRRDLETIYLGNEYSLTKDMVREAMGMELPETCS